MKTRPEIRQQHGFRSVENQSDQKSHSTLRAAKPDLLAADPSHAQHPVTMGWADNKYAQASNLSSYLPVGRNLTGNLQFSGGARIDCNNGNTVLSNRGCFELLATVDKPIS